MAINIDKNKARAILLKANEQKSFANDSIGESIKDILSGTHKTYKYLLVNALLAKSVSQKVDPFSLQAGDDSKGAYDARSLCHQVLVPFERKFYTGSLGGSNEPFLNKPARFKRLAYDNAVRPGNDKNTLGKLIRLLELIKTKEQAFKYLATSIAVMAEIYQKIEPKYHLEKLPIGKEGNVQTILDYVSELCNKTFGGETCVLVVATIEAYHWKGKGQVRAHKVNESGSSSKEIGDIDIFDKNGTVLSSIEVKDKQFSKEDVDHAIRKFATVGVERSMFIYGKNAQFNRSEVFQVAARYGRAGYFCGIVPIMDYAKMRITHIMHDTTITEFIDKILYYAKSINANNDTIEWVKNCTKQMTAE